MIAADALIDILQLPSDEETWWVVFVRSTHRDRDLHPDGVATFRLYPITGSSDKNEVEHPNAFHPKCVIAYFNLQGRISDHMKHALNEWLKNNDIITSSSGVDVRVGWVDVRGSATRYPPEDDDELLETRLEIWLHNSPDEEHQVYFELVDGELSCLAME